MNTFLDDYGAAEARRARILKRVTAGLFIVLVAGGGLYVALRDRRENKQVQTFFSLLSNKRYEEAYRTWGCTNTAPCRDYPYEKFLEDWGPKSTHADLSKMQIVRTGFVDWLRSSRSCQAGIIQIVRFGSDDEVRLWVQRGDLTLGFAPWPVCNPRIPSPGQ